MNFDENELGKTVKTELGIVSDFKSFMADLVKIYCALVVENASAAEPEIRKLDLTEERSMLEN